MQQIGRTDPRRLRERQRMPGSDKGLADKLRAKPRFLVAACRIAQLRFGQPLTHCWRKSREKGLSEQSGLVTI